MDSIKDWVRKQELDEYLAKLYTTIDLVKVVENLTEEQKSRVDDLVRGMMRLLTDKTEQEKNLYLLHYLILLYVKLIKEGYTDEDIDKD